MKKEIPNYDSSINGLREISVINDDSGVKVNLGKVDLVNFHTTFCLDNNNVFPISYGDIHGFLELNPLIFNGIYEQFSKGPKSQMLNVSKCFFVNNSNNYVALVQYLQAFGHSGEHYHNLEEVIVQLAGESLIEMRQIENDENKVVRKMISGDKLYIPSKIIHRVLTIDSDSLTMPIKQTDIKKKDHFYKPKSIQRIKRELEHMFFSEFFESGNALINSLDLYFQDLFETEEHMNFSRVMKDIYKNSNNSIIQGFIEKYL